MKNSRIEFIDLAKGICIFLVTVGHCGVNVNIPGMEIVRMPLYFILSGLFYKDYGGVFNLLKKKTNNIIVPFIFFYLIGYVAFYLIKFFQPELLITEARGVFDVFDNRQYFNGPIWFLLALFWCNIYYFAINKFTSKFLGSSFFYNAIIIGMVGLIGNLLGDYNFFTPFFLDAAMTALPFFYFGIVIKKLPILYPNKMDKYLLLICISLYCISVLISTNYYHRLSLHYNGLDGLATYPLAITSVLSILFFCKMIGYFPIISFIGKYSIVILCVHHMYYRPIKVILSKLQLETLNNEYTVAIITLILSIASIPICKKYIPHFIAQKELIK